MIALLLSILSSTLIFVVFKLFDRFQINTFQAIVVNYAVAASCGLLLFEGPIDLRGVPQFDWWPFALALGVLFIVIFYLMAWTTQRSGLSVVSVATKMSVVVPIVFGLWYYHEHLGPLKGLGIVLALISVYLTSLKSESVVLIDKRNIIFPILVFLGSGIIDTSLKYLENTYVSPEEVPLFSSSIFFGAFSLGILLLAFRAVKKKRIFSFKSLLGGIALGIPNYFSVFFLLKALKSNLLESSGIFTVNNVAIVMLSTLMGILLFQERLRWKNWVGVTLAVVSICLIALERI